MMNYFAATYVQLHISLENWILFQSRISNDIWIKGDQALLSKVISFIIEGHYSMTLGVLQIDNPFFALCANVC